MSFAYWNAGGDWDPVTSKGQVGLFYVDYDKPYVEDSTITTNVPAYLKDDISSDGNAYDGESNSVILQFKKSATDSSVITVKFVSPAERRV